MLFGCLAACRMAHARCAQQKVRQQLQTEVTQLQKATQEAIATKSSSFAAGRAVAQARLGITAVVAQLDQQV